MAEQIYVAVDDAMLLAGDTAMVTVAIMNDGDEPLNIPPSITATLQHLTANQAVEIVLIGAQETIEVRPGAYQRATFQLITPATFPTGYVQLHFNNLKTTPLILRVEGGEKTIASTPPVKQETAASKEYSIGYEKEKTDTNLLGGLAPYKPIYFLAGAEPLEGKFQISFQYQLFNKGGTWAKALPFLPGFHLAYTQLSFWNLEAESKPFEDTNYMPEIFYELDADFVSFMPKGMTLQAGLLHESNGRDGLDSRSLNIFYGRTSIERPLPDSVWGDNLFAGLTADVWSYVGDITENPDIADFRGHSSIELTVGKHDGVQLSAYRRGRIGKGSSSYMFDLTTPIKWDGKSKNINFNLHAQLFTGYGENLLTYDQKETRFRLGIGLHR
ncbi:MAG: phospholipase A [Kordiimonadaceae bacterium]|nr:phospholipase A [Kordiimonadaceae bacterium]